LGRIEPRLLQAFRLLAPLSASRYAFAMDAGTAKVFGTGTPRPRTQGGFRWEKESFDRYRICQATERVAILKEQPSLMPPDAAKSPNS